MLRRKSSGRATNNAEETRVQILYERSYTGNQSGIKRSTDVVKWMICDSSADELKLTWQLRRPTLDWASHLNATIE